MRTRSGRLIAVFATLLLTVAFSVRCGAAESVAPPGGASQCQGVYTKITYLWTIFQKAVDHPSPPAYRFTEASLWHVAPYLDASLCPVTNAAQDRAKMDAKRFEIGLLFTIVGAFTESYLKKYHNARAFTNMFHAGVAASVTNTTEARAALAVVRSDRPGFDQFLSTWTQKIKKLDAALDKLGIPKGAQLDQSEKPAH